MLAPKTNLQELGKDGLGLFRNLNAGFGTHEVPNKLCVDVHQLALGELGKSNDDDGEPLVSPSYQDKPSFAPQRQDHRTPAFTHCVDENVSYLPVSVPVIHSLCQLLQEVFMHSANLRDLVEYLLHQGRVHQSRGLGASQGVMIHLRGDSDGFSEKGPPFEHVGFTWSVL